jgi:hypothetical protein
MLQAPSIRAKMEATNIAKTILSIPAFQETIKNTNRSLYGTNYPLESSAIKAKAQATMMRKYGVAFAHQSISIRTKTRQTCLRKFGTEFASQSPEVSAKRVRTFLAIYGADHPMHNREHALKAIKRGFKCKDFIFPTGEKIQVQGYEHHCLCDLLQQGVEASDLLQGYTNMPQIKYTHQGKEHCYYPDIYNVARRQIIEVKSQFTYDLDPQRNASKMHACLKAGYEAELRIYSYKGILLSALIPDPVSGEM